MTDPREGPIPRQRAARWLAAAPLLALAACVSLERPPAAKRRFVLDVRRPEASPPAADGCLLVVPFRVLAPWAGPGFVHLRPGGEVEADFLHEFFVPPGVMLADCARRWFADAGLFVAAVGEGSRVAPTLVLEADVLTLALDHREGAAAAVLEVDAFVVDAQRRLVYRGRHGHRAALAGEGPEAAVAAFERCTAAVLAEVERALRTVR